MPCSLLDLSSLTRDWTGATAHCQILTTRPPGSSQELFCLIEIWLIHNVVLVSGIQQSDLVIYTFIRSDQIRSVPQSLSRVRLFATPWIAARQASLSITNSRSSLRLMSIESVMPSSHLILCRPLLLPPIPPSIRVFSNESISFFCFFSTIVHYKVSNIVPCAIQ